MEKVNTNIENKEEKNQLMGYCLSVRGDLSVSSCGTTSTYNASIWSQPIEVAHKIFGDRIEFIYKKDKLIWGGYSAQESAAQESAAQESAVQESVVYKIVYSCKEGKWNKSEPIYGRIIEPQEEQYEFDN